MTESEKQLAIVRRWQNINLVWFFVSGCITAVLALPAWFAARKVAK